MGLILYELLTGKMPFKAESAVASLLKRNQEQAAPVSDHDQTIPRALSNIVAKCLERDPALRYQTATEFLQDLEIWQGKSAAAHITFPHQRKALGTNYSLALDRGHGGRPGAGDYRLPAARRVV